MVWTTPNKIAGCGCKARLREARGHLYNAAGLVEPESLLLQRLHQAVDASPATMTDTIYPKNTGWIVVSGQICKMERDSAHLNPFRWCTATVVWLSA